VRFSTKFLLVYDMKSKIDDGERRAIYRRLNKAFHDILKQGRYALRVQMSVWETETKEDAYRLASCLPSDKTRVKIYRILGEE
jgi:CRISPR/Cas system-associated endoribonuclease Cas2